MGKVAYVPFTDSGLRGYVDVTASTFNSARHFDKFETPVLSYPDSLAGVSSGTQLYVFGHGSPMSETVSDNAHNKLTMRELAKRLKEAGLTPSITKIKLAACNGGTCAAQSTAAKLLVALRAEGFVSVTVYGYYDKIMVQAEEGSKRGPAGERMKDFRLAFK